MTRTILAGLASVSLLAGASALAQISSMSATEIEALLSEAGLNPEVISDRDTGAPVAMGKLGQINFVVRALECDGDPLSCEQLLFFANFDLNRDVTEEDYRIINGFNDSSYDGRAYVLEDTRQIGVDFYIDLTGGVTADHVSSRLERWQGVVSGFLDEMRNANTGS